MNSQPTMIDLFAGCGGMTLGFQEAGYRPALAVEHDLAAASTYALNFGVDHVFYGDIVDLSSDRVPEVDLVIGGPPCQGFSNLGSRNVNDPRNVLWREYFRVVEAVRPKVFVLENVQRFRRSPEFGLLLAAANTGPLSDYELREGVLLAADYGVAQRRPRTFVIGSRVGPIDLPEPTHGRPDSAAVRAGMLKPWNTVRARIGRVEPMPSATDLPNRTADILGRRVPGSFTSRNLHVGRRARPLSIARYDHVPPGGGRFDVPEALLPRCWREKPTGTTDVMGRMRWDAPSLTIRTEFFKPEKGQYLHPQWDRDEPSNRVNRPITHFEAALLQDFPETFLWCGSKVEIARQIGNAVPVGLARAVGVHVAKAMAQPAAPMRNRDPRGQAIPNRDGAGATRPR